MNNKIRSVAQLILILEIIALIFLVIFSICTHDYSGFLYAILLVFFAWINYVILDGLAEILDNTIRTLNDLHRCSGMLDKLDAKITQSKNNIKSPKATSNEKETTNLEDNQKRELKVDKKHIPVKVFPSNNVITCPTCEKKLPASELECTSCGQRFINGQKSVPYWCGKCGAEGPFEGACQNCGSSIKIFNY